MIAALWHRFFDVRRHRKARERAEGNYSRALVREAELARENKDLRQANDRLAVAAGGADALDDTLGATQRALDEAKARIKALEVQLDEVAAENVKAHRIVDLHAQVSALPPALTRDREALSRLSGELADARVRIEKCEREHR